MSGKGNNDLENTMKGVEITKLPVAAEKTAKSSFDFDEISILNEESQEANGGVGSALTPLVHRRQQYPIIVKADVHSTTRTTLSSSQWADTLINNEKNVDEWQSYIEAQVNKNNDNNRSTADLVASQPLKSALKLSKNTDLKINAPKHITFRSPECTVDFFPVNATNYVDEFAKIRPRKCNGECVILTGMVGCFFVILVYIIMGSYIKTS